MLNKDDDNNASSPRKFVLEEFIWGHRLHDDQDINMVLLEFLCAIQNLPFSEYSPNKFVYQIPRRKVLRALIFNNPQIEAIRGASGKSCLRRTGRTEISLPRTPAGTASI